ncbi:MAG: cytochrome c oxidase subunit II [Acidiferrobacterales bacterium]|nr:cytochrome c oxidase subunit II [Acidiferrobacterales bacterium]
MLVTQSKRLILHPLQKLLVVAASCYALLGSGLAQAEYALNFQTPVTEVARDIYGLHMLIFWICVAIFVAVFGVMFYSIFKHRKSKNFEPSQFSHSTKVEIVWTVIPFLILVAMAVPATQVLIKMEDTTKSDLTIKITGYQWKWGYEYLDSGIEFYSTLTTPREQIDQFNTETAEPPGENYLLETDNHVIVPSGRKVRALITANDVIHAWWIPAFGTKKDAIPGYINELWFNVDEGKEGIYRGQCAELCGKDHAYMPIVVEVVTAEKFDNWVASGGTSFDAQAIANVTESTESTESAVEAAAAVVESVVPSAEAAVVPAVEAKEWSKDELMALGEETYSNCIACHGADGKGITGVFPAIAGSAVATGEIGSQIDLVMFGKPGTAMVAFASQLSDEEIAAVVTYQRNAFGNNVGDFVSPADVKAKR